MSRNSTAAAAAVKLGIFSAVSIFVTTMLVIIMGNIGLGSTHTYQAIFTTASGLKKGNDVRVAGVTVGEVKKVEIYERKHARVTFTANQDLPLTVESRAEIRFLNLIGDRYLALEQGTPGAAPLEPDATIPMRLTSPSLDLTVLFNGFQPLFAALRPEQVNQLSLNLVQVLQGEGGTIRSLLASTASLTNDLADRDRLIGEVIVNLDGMLQTVNERHEELDTLVIEMRNWMTGLARDRQAIGQAVTNVSTLTEEVARLLTQGRPLIKEDVRQLRELMTRLNKQRNRAVVNELLDRLPEMMSDQTRSGTYGSWYNYYLCDFDGRIRLPALRGPGAEQLQDELMDFTFHSTAARCNQS